MRKEYDFSGGRQGAVVPAPRAKTRITICLDDDVLDWFRQRVEAASAGNCQTLINDALHQVLDSSREPQDTVVRWVVRDELRRHPTGRRAARHTPAA